MATVRTYSQLAIQLQKARDNALKGVAKESIKVVEKEIDKEVYSIPEGDYERTYALRDSLIDSALEIKGNSATVKISHDWVNMQYNVAKFQHASPYWSPWKYTQYVAETVHEGTSGNLFGENRHWHNRKPYMDNAKETMKSGKYRSLMVEQLRKNGYKVL